jgi:hypothetical protein
MAADEHQGSVGLNLRDVVHNIEVTWLLHTTYSERTALRMRDGRHNDRCV